MNELAKKRCLNEVRFRCTICRRLIKPFYFWRLISPHTPPWSICSKRIHLETCWPTSVSINRMVARPPSLFAFELPCRRDSKSIAKIVNTFPELGRFGRSGGILLFWFGSILHSPAMFWQFQILPKAWGLGFQTHPWRLLWMPKAEESGCNRLVLRGLRAWGKTRVQQNASGFRNTPRISDLTGPAFWVFLRLGLKRTIPVLLSLVPTLVEKRMDNKCQPCFNVFAKDGEFRLLLTWFPAKWSWQFGTQNSQLSPGLFYVTSSCRCHVLSWCASTRRIPRSRVLPRCFPFHQQISEISSCQISISLRLLPPCFATQELLPQLMKEISSGPWPRWPQKISGITWSWKQRFHNDKFSFVLLCGRTTQEFESSSHNNIFEMLQVSLHPCRKVFSSGSRMLIKKSTVL